MVARKHAAASMLSGHCRVDAGAFPWPISPPKSLQCSLCDDETVYTSTGELHDHSVAVHWPKPSPVSLPIASVAKSFQCRVMPAVLEGNNAGSGGCPDGGRREEKRRLTRRKSGGWRTWFSNAKQGDSSRSARRRGLPRGLEKEACRLLQKHHAAGGHPPPAVSEDRTGNEVTVRSHLRHDLCGNGARRGEEHEGTDASAQRGSPGSGQRPHTGSTSDLVRGGHYASSVMNRAS